MEHAANIPEQPRFELGRGQLWLLFGFLATVFLADFALSRSRFSVVVPKVHTANQAQLLAHRLRPEAEDVLIVGSSRVKAGVDPNLITRYLVEGLTPEDGPKAPQAVRLPVQGIRAWALHQIVRDFIAKKPPTKLLVIGLEERFFYVPPFEAEDPFGMRIFGETRDWLEINPLELSGLEFKNLCLAPLRGVQAPFALASLLRNDVKSLVYQLQTSRGMPPHGFETLDPAEFELARELRDEIAASGRQFGSEDLRPFELHAFDRTLDLLEQLPCQVVFVRFPVLAEFDAEQRFELQRFEELVLSKLAERGFEYFDMNTEEVLREDRFFQNPSHANRRGQLEFSRWLALEVIGPKVLQRPLPGFDSEPSPFEEPGGPQAIEAGAPSEETGLPPAAPLESKKTR